MQKTPLIKAVLKHSALTEQQNTATIKTINSLCEAVSVSPNFLSESVVNMLGKVYARMNNNQPFDGKLSPGQLKTLAKLITGAEIIQTNPEAIDAHNLKPNVVKLALTGGGSNEKANQILIQLANSSPSAVNSILGTLEEYDRALSNGDTERVKSICSKIQSMWLKWQKTEQQYLS